VADGRVLLLRHGETEWSRSGRHTGRTDVPLTERGRELARTAGTLGARLLDHRPPALVLTSPRRRARDTAELAGLPVDRVDPRLAEWDYGDYEGRTTEEIRRSAPGWSLWTDGTPGRETPDDVGERVDAFIREIRAIDGDIALFSHGHLSRALAARWIDLPVSAGQSLLFATAAIGVFGRDRGTPVIERWNDDSHLWCAVSSTGGPGGRDER
jgi:probable phosphoglycerate mutase